MVDWFEIVRVWGISEIGISERGYDWVSWQEDDGLIKAAHVFPTNGSEEETLAVGDIFYELDYVPYFELEALQGAIEGVPSGGIRTYTVQRGNQQIEVDVTFTRYPTFLYPLSLSLWQFSIWGFVFGCFFHVLGLIVVVPLARRSKKAQYALLLIVVSSLWMFGNLLRILMVELLGPIGAGTRSDLIFQTLTLIGLAGWISFPALLLHKVLSDIQESSGSKVGPARYIIYVPTVILIATALWSTIRGSIGPITLDGLVAPILFYACCYVAAAGAFVLMLRVSDSEKSEEVFGGWSRSGSILMVLVSILFALSILGVVPLFGTITETISGWFVVGAQLLSTVPVVLVSMATLKLGKLDLVLSRAFTYLATLGLIFFAFVGGMTALEPLIAETDVSLFLIGGVYVVLLLILFERIARRVRVYAANFFATERQQARQQLSRFQEQMKGILDYDTLAQETITTVGNAFHARSGRLFLLPFGYSGRWISSAFHPEPPYLTERVVSSYWSRIENDSAIWAMNPELNESTLPPSFSERFAHHGVSISVPIKGSEEVLGLLVLGKKKQRRAVYNLEDIDLLRSLSGQLAIAIERLSLVEREKALIRETAEAQLSALRAQINPHFLFNALNTVVSLIEEQPNEAVEVVEHLASIFRYILKTGGRSFVTLQEEFDLVSHYLSIEKARFGDRLVVEHDCAPDLLAERVPAFAIQTLVENSIKHGLEKRRNGGTLSLSCRSDSDHLIEIEVADTGIGIPELFGKGDLLLKDASFLGIGLKNVSNRLQMLYDRTDLLRMRSDPETGTTVLLSLPAPSYFKTESSSLPPVS